MPYGDFVARFLHLHNVSGVKFDLNQDQYLISVCGWIIFHCMDRPHFVCLLDAALLLDLLVIMNSASVNIHAKGFSLKKFF